MTIAYTNSGALEKNRSGAFVGYIFCFKPNKPSPIPFAGPCVEYSSEGTNCRCTSTSGDFVRWESSSEGSNRRCKSLAAKALSAAANSIETLITISIRFTL